MGSAASNPRTIGEAVKIQKEKIDEAHVIMNRGVANHSKSGQDRHEVAAKKTADLSVNAAKALEVDLQHSKGVNDSLAEHKLDWAKKLENLKENGKKSENCAPTELQPLVRNLVTQEIDKLNMQMEELLVAAQAAASEAQKDVSHLDEHVQKKIPEVKQKSQTATDVFLKDCEAVRKKVQEAEEDAMKRISALLEEITKLDAKMNANVLEVEQEQLRTDQAVRAQMKLAEESVRKAAARTQTLLATREKNYKQSLYEVQLAVEKARDIRAEKALQEVQKHQAANFGFNVLNSSVKAGAAVATYGMVR